MLTSWTRRRGLVLIAALTLLGGVLRVSGLGGLGLEHFDEGIYALSGLWVLSPKGLFGIDPTVIPYAPAGFPFLVGLSYMISFPWPGVSGLGAIAPALLCGVATIPVAAWLGKRTFGPGAGVAAAAFAALSGPHLAFSRVALTDAPFLLTWLVGFALGGRFLERPSLGRAVVLGVAVGLAQYLKYNGWLVGAIVAVTALCGLVDQKQRALAALGFGIAAAAVAAILYAPWYAFVEAHGGYAALNAHHRSYLSGGSAWLPHLRQQLAQGVALSGLVNAQFSFAGIAWVCAWFCAGLVLPRASANGREAQPAGMAYRFALLGGTALLGVLPTAPWWLGLAWLPYFFRGCPALRLVGVWWLTMSILTPFYHPYARLWLPLTAVGWIIVAGGVAQFYGTLCGRLDESGAVPEQPSIWSRRGAVGAGVVVACAGIVQFGLGPRPVILPGLLGRSDSVRSIAHEAAKRLSAETGGGAGTPLSVLARPPFSFYFQVNLGVPVRVVPSLSALFREPPPPEAFVLIDEVQLLQEPPDVRASVLGRLERVAPWFDTLNTPTLLDVDPSAAFGTSFLAHSGPGDRADTKDSRSQPQARVWLVRSKELRGAIP